MLGLTLSCFYLTFNNQHSTPKSGLLFAGCWKQRVSNDHERSL